MKKILPGILAVVMVLFSIVCTATYIVHLEDGRSLTVDKYWVEGDQIKFSRGGGVVGIRKNSVLTIEKTDALAEPPEKKKTGAEIEGLPAEAGTIEKKEPGKGTTDSETSGKTEIKDTEKGQTEQHKETNGDTEDKKTESEKKAYFLKEKFRIDQEMDRLYTEYNEAKKTGDKNTQNRCFLELKLLRTELMELENRAKASSDGKIPEWWDAAR